MTNEEILKAALQKTAKNGWDRGTNKGDLAVGKMLAMYPQVIFSHDFAKAFWGEKLIWQHDLHSIPSWQDKLKEMVVSEHPIKYLEQFL